MLNVHPQRNIIWGATKFCPISHVCVTMMPLIILGVYLIIFAYHTCMYATD
jgi:hypothetical protein